MSPPLVPTASIAIVVVLITAGLRGQRAEWTVDPLGGPGVHFTALQAAADAAAPGDVLRVGHGDVGPLDTSKPLVVLGTPYASPSEPGTLAGTIAVRDTPAGSEFVLADVRLPAPSAEQAAFTAIDCGGRIVVQRSRPGFGVGYPHTPHFRYRVADCREVALMECTETTHRGLIALRSTVHLAGCSFRIDGLEVLPCGGFSAVDAGQCDLWLSGTTCTGSYASCVPGYGLRVVDGTVHLAGTATRPTVLASRTGSNGLHLVGSTIVRGQHVSISGVRQFGGALLTRPLPVVAASAERGGMATAVMEPATSAVAALAFWLAAPPRQLPGLGELGVDPATACQAVAATAGLPLTTSFPVPNNPLLIGAAFAAQGIELGPAAATLSNRALLVLR